jgi:hypothetical protein
VPRAPEAAATHVHRKSPGPVGGSRLLALGTGARTWPVMVAPTTRVNRGVEGAAARLVEWKCRRAAAPSTTGDANQEGRRRGFKFGHERRRAFL